MANNARKMHRLKKIEFKVEPPPKMMGEEVGTVGDNESDWNFSETSAQKKLRDSKLQTFMVNDEVLVRPKKKQVPFPTKSVSDMKKRLF